MSVQPSAGRGFPDAALDDAAVAGAGWNIHRDFETPFAALDAARLAGNSALVHGWARRAGAELWPHAKTVMSAALVRQQLADGSRGITVATAQQARRAREWGVERLLIANQLVQPSALAWAARDRIDRPGTELWSFVDSPEGVALLQDAAGSGGVVFDVLVETGLPGGRTGVRDEHRLAALMDALEASPGVRPLGVAAFEGAYAGDRGETSLAAVDGYLGVAVDVLDELIRRGVVSADEAVFSAGGSMFFDRVVLAASRSSHRLRTVIRAGCVMIHDHGLYMRGTPLPGSSATPGLEPALTVWATVHSRPEPTRAFADAGRRDVSYDQGLPVVLRRLPRGEVAPEPLPGVTVVALNDHHAHLVLAEDAVLEVGDRIELGISHPCTTMDRWRRIPLVAPGGDVVGAVTTEF